MLLIQLLGSQWTKKDRNIEATRERAAAPIALSFQTPQLPEFGECWLQSRDVRRIDWTARVAAGIVEVLRLDTETLRVGLSAAIGLANSVALGVNSIAKLGRRVPSRASWRERSIPAVFERETACSRRCTAVQFVSEFALRVT